MASLPGLDAYASDSSGSEMDEVEARQDDTTGPGDDAGEVLKQVELEMAEAGVIRAGDLSASAGGAAAESDSSSSSESDSDDEVIGAAMASINRDAIADDEVTDAGSLIPPRSRHEIEPPPAQPLPENLNVDVASLQPIGSVLSKVLSEGTVVVKGMSGVPPLDEDSLLCTKGVADTPRVFPLGRVHELFGPVTLPHYIVKCPEQGVLASLSLGDTVYSVQGMSSYLRPEAILGGKGCDASNMHDEEVRLLS
jgi:rRNA processing protein Gar1